MAKVMMVECWILGNTVWPEAGTGREANGDDYWENHLGNDVVVCVCVSGDICACVCVAEHTCVCNICAFGYVCVCVCSYSGIIPSTEMN